VVEDGVDDRLGTATVNGVGLPLMAKGVELALAPKRGRLNLLGVAAVAGA
jgi:hypothetical protein